MTVRYITLRQRLPMSSEDAFEALTDAHSLGKNFGGEVTIVAGPSRTNVGTVRRIKAAGLNIDEEITTCNRPHRLVYRIVSGLPVKYHHGELLFEDDGSGTLVTWTIGMQVRRPLSTRLILAVLSRALKKGLATVAK